MKSSNSPTRIARHLERLLPRETRERMQQIRLIGHSLDSLLPPRLRAHCAPAGIEGNELVLIADSGTWATQLRYQQQQILKQLNADLGLNLRRLRVRIAPRASTRERRQVPPRQISPGAARTLKEAARSMPDRALGEILLRLARKGEQQQ